MGLILLFGSRVSGLIHPDSDVDIAVLVEEQYATQVSSIELTCAFMELLGTSDVDVVLLNDADYFLRYEVTQNCRVIYEARPDVYLSYAYRAMQGYEAHKPLEKLRQELLHERILHKSGADSSKAGAIAAVLRRASTRQ